MNCLFQPIQLLVSFILEYDQRAYDAISNGKSRCLAGSRCQHAKHAHQTILEYDQRAKHVRPALVELPVSADPTLGVIQPMTRYQIANPSAWRGPPHAKHAHQTILEYDQRAKHVRQTKHDYTRSSSL